MGYTTDDDMVRVDFFKPSGKWYTTEAVKWTGGYSADHSIYEAFQQSLRVLCPLIHQCSIARVFIWRLLI